MDLLLSYTPGLLDLVVVLLGLVMWPRILLSRKQPAAMLAWLLGVTFIPVLGPLFFVVFGWRPRLPALPRKKVRSDRLIRPLLETRLGDEPRADPHDASVPATVRTGLAVADRVGAYPLTPGNRVAFCDGAAEKYEALLNDIAAARHHVHLEYFKLRDDGFGQRLAAALCERARAGVEVRLLIDGVGSIWLSRRYIARLRAGGVQFTWFHPLNPLRRRWSLNIRNHRKIAVIDGRVGYVGGINLGDEYLGLDPASGEWHDLAVRIEGGAVHSLQRVFCEDWHFAAGTVLADPQYFPANIGARGGSVVQVVNSLPGDDLVTEMHLVVFALLTAAQRRAWLMTPYFLPDETIQTALASLALGGVDVRVMVSRRIRERVVAIASRSYFPSMLEAGVRIFRFRPDATLHAKALLIDDGLMIVGSANLDQRSFHINFETGTLIHDPECGQQLAHWFEDKMAQGEELSAEGLRGRPLPVRAVESLARLAAPLF